METEMVFCLFNISSKKVIWASPDNLYDNFSFKNNSESLLNSPYLPHQNAYPSGDTSFTEPIIASEKETTFSANLVFTNFPNQNLHSFIPRIKCNKKPNLLKEINPDSDN